MYSSSLLVYYMYKNAGFVFLSEWNQTTVCVCLKLVLIVIVIFEEFRSFFSKETVPSMKPFPHTHTQTASGLTCV